MYNSCEIDTNLPGCESQDAAMASDGYTWEVDFIGLAAHKTGANSLQAWFQYDASIHLGQILNVKNALLDANPLTGTSLVTSYPSLASDCGASDDEQIISCVESVASSVPNFNYAWYIYDEPGCPNQSIGYCAGTLAGGNYGNVATLAQYIESIDPTHAVRGVQTAGGCTNGCGPVEQMTIDNLFSCNNQPQCAGQYSWITGAGTPNTGFDYYPLGPAGQSIDDIGAIAGDIANTIAANYPSETLTFTVQAFSWYQEGGGFGCTSIAVCPYPTAGQMQQMRDQAIYYAGKAGKPLAMVLWYYWPDITCEGASGYAGCNATANRQSVRSAAFAPFPATPPPS